MKHKPSVSKEHPSQNPPVQFDVPADNSCLFWATTLAYLIPVKDDEDGFKQRYTALFGNEKIIHISYVRKLIQNYNPLLNEVPSDDILKDLVSNTFRNRVVDYIQSHEDEFRDYISDGFSEYLGNMRKPDTFGDQPEIMAMSEMLGAKVTVSGATKSEYGNGDFPIQLFHVSIIEEGALNHYRFGLPQNIIDTYRKNIPGQQSSAKPELIELLLTEPINPKSSRENLVLLINREKLIGFAEKFGLFLEETPCIGSTSKEEFFIHAILGSVLTLPNSGLMQKLGIKNVYVKHDMKVKSVDNQEVVSSDIIKLCFVFEKDGKKQVALRVFANDKTEGYKNPEDEYRYSDGELKEITEKLGISNIDVDEHVFRIRTEGDPGNKSFRLRKWQIDVEKERLKKGSPPSQTDEFKKVSADNALDLGDSFKDLSHKNVEVVIGGTKKIFKELVDVYRNNQEKLSLRKSEAAYHGFFYGALALNFKYRYGLNCYVERTAGNGRADLTLISRTKDANSRVNPEPIQVIVEFKAGDHTASEAIKQIKDKGYLYNLSVRTRAKDAVIVGVNPAQSDALQVKQDVIFQSQGFINQVLKQREEFNPDRVDNIKNILKGELKNLYYSIPSHDQHYLSKVIFGQVLAAEADVKYIFIYKAKDKSIGEKATTFVLFNQNKAVILNIIEHTQKEPEVDPYGRTRTSKKQASEKQASVSKILPIHELGINSAVKIDVKIRTGENLGGFEVEGSKYKSYYQDINIEEVSYIGCERKYSGEFKEIINVDVGKLIQELKGKLTKPESKDQSSDSEDLSKTKSENQLSYSEDLPKTKSESELSYLSKILFNHKELISKERDFQAILQGLFMNGEDENNREIRVYAESNISSKGRIDLMLSFVHLEIDGSLEEDCPIIIELKYADSLSNPKAELNKAEEQSDRKYNLIRSCTSKRTAYSLVIVFNKGAKRVDKLIWTRIKDFKVPHTTSPSETDSQTVVDSPEINSEYTASSSDEKQRLDEFDFQEDSLLSQRKKRKKSAELYKEPKRSVKPENYLDNVSVQVHSTQARDLGEM